ncbi:MAG TPA: hypothetical protein VGO11_21695 [Chthoniobacteraceae bacterium]|nr:hypothetical protein [Chthoniobacteraceae bacterium]
MKTLGLFLLLILLAHAAPAEDSVTVPPLKIAPNAKTERDFAKAELAWGERALIAPFRIRAEGKPWLEEACEFVRHALGEWPGAEITSEIARLSAQGQRLLAAGCDDPLIGYYATWARWMATDEHYASREAFNKLRKAAEKLPGQSALARMATADFLRLNAIVQQGAEDAPKKYVELAVRAWSDGSFNPEEDVVFTRHLVKDMTRKVLEKHQNALLVALQPVELPPWVRETLVGQAEIVRAWQSRGSGFGNTVTEEGWKGFGEHLEKAHHHLVHAWQLRKDQPMAATMLITVAMGGGVPEKESERLWFERAVAAQCDYEPAYDALFYSLMPQWGGDDGEILAIGKSCLATKRYDTEVPTQFFTALHYLNRMVDGRMPDIRDLLRRPEIAPFQRELLRGCLEEKTRADKRRIWQAWVAVDDWLRGDDAAAARSLAECGPGTLPPEACLQLRNLGTDEVGFRGEVAVLNSPARALFLEANQLRGEEKYPLAAETYERAAALTEGAAAARLRALASVAGVEAKLAAGDWATVPPDPSLGSWIQRAGVWSATPEGYPMLREGDGPVRIAYGARVGRDFEVRATLDVSGEPQAKWMTGLTYADFNFIGKPPGYRGVFIRFDKGKTVGTARGFTPEFVMGQAGVDCPLLPSNEIALRYEAGNITWTFNGKKIQTDQKIGGINAFGMVGFGSYKHTAGVTISLKKMEIRRLGVTPP